MLTWFLLFERRRVIGSRFIVWFRFSRGMKASFRDALVIVVVTVLSVPSRGGTTNFSHSDLPALGSLGINPDGGGSREIFGEKLSMRSFCP